MAELRLIEQRVVGQPYYESPYLKLTLQEATIEMVKDDSSQGRQFTIKREVVSARDGGNVLAYFSSNGEWGVVLVKQFRVPVGTVTYEAPGGIVEGNVQESMARELKEEAGIDIDPTQIEVVFHEYFLPPLISASAWGGVVQINESQLPQALEHGEESGGECTILLKMPINEVRSKVKQKVIKLDLWTSRLLDEVEKKTKYENNTRKGERI